MKIGRALRLSTQPSLRPAERIEFSWPYDLNVCKNHYRLRRGNGIRLASFGVASLLNGCSLLFNLDGLTDDVVASRNDTDGSSLVDSAPEVTEAPPPSLDSDDVGMADSQEESVARDATAESGADETGALADGAAEESRDGALSDDHVEASSDSASPHGGNDAATDAGAGAPVCGSAAYVVEIPGLVLWLMGDKGVVANGNNVASWADQSGKGNNANQTTVSLQPLLVPSALNGHSVVRFGSNGALNALEVADAVTLQWGADDFTIEMVLRYTNTSTNTVMYAKQLANPAPYPGASLWGNQVFAGSGTFAAQVEYQDGYFAPSSTAGLNDGTPRLYGGRRTGGTNLAARVNGVAVGAQVTPTVVNVSEVGIPVSFGLIVANGVDTEQLDGDSAEVAAIHGTLAASDLACLESYLITKYAL
jgi:hypothetical protein